MQFHFASFVILESEKRLWNMFKFWKKIAPIYLFARWLCEKNGEICETFTARYYVNLNREFVFFLLK